MQHLPIPTHTGQFQKLAACVLIPTYNNAQTLEAVLRSVAAVTQDIIVVNDGSTDGTEEILSGFGFLKVLGYKRNRGKGYALRRGLAYALQLGYRYAITIDSDGQHYPSDLPVFLEAAERRPGALVIGARNMEQEHIPGKSTFGNKFSNFWFWVETGLRLPDTQSGYRLYPLQPLSSMKFFTRKYEFEIEAPVRLAWKGITIASVPVKVYYPPVEERISHFRPFRDFARISVLNTVLTFIALLWIHPRNFIRKLGSAESRNALWNRFLLRPEESNWHKALSLSFGVFMGIFPVWGFQLLIGIPLAVFFRLNRGLFLLGANVSIFPLTPLVWALSLFTGKLILGYEHWHFYWRDVPLHQFQQAGLAFFLGGAVLAVLLSCFTFLLSYLVLHYWRKPADA